MAKTIDSAKNATPEDLVEEENPQDAADSALEGEDGDEEDLTLPVDPTAEDSSRALISSRERGAATVSGSGGIYVPDALMANPITRWLAEAYIELRKVTWPDMSDAWNMTLIVIVVSAVMAALLAASDFGLGHLLSYFVSLGLGR